MIKRRQLLVRGLAMTGLALLPEQTMAVSRRSVANLAQPNQGVAVFSKAYFVSLLNTWFYVYDPQAKREVPLALVEVKDGAHTSLLVEQFSIILHGPMDSKLPSTTYWIQHPEIGRFQLFLQEVPNGSFDEYYAAHFNLKH